MLRDRRLAVTAAALAVALALLTGACTDGAFDAEPASGPAPTPSLGELRTAWPSEVKEVRFGVTPYLEQAALREVFQPPLTYLQRRIGVPFRLVIATDYADIVRRLRDGEIEMAEFSPLAYVLAKDQVPGLQPLVKQVTEGATSYLGYVIVRGDDLAESLADLRGRSFCYVDPLSSSGYAYPRAMLREAGFDPDTFFSRTVFGGNHESCIRKVLERETDGAAIFARTFYVARREGLPVDQLKIVAKTDRIPNDPYCVPATLPQAAAKRLREELLALSTRTPAGRKFLQGPLRLNAWVDVDDHDFDSVRRALLLSLGVRVPEGLVTKLAAAGVKL